MFLQKKWQYLWINNGILIVLPYVVVYEDVLNMLIEWIDPEWLPPTVREGISSPPGQRGRDTS